MTTHDDKDLQAMFAETRAQEVPVSDALMDRIMQDADQVLAATQTRQVPSSSRPGLWASLLEAVGGWPSASGLAAATVAGLWIGVAAPDVLATLSGGLWGDAFEVPLLESDLLAGLEG